MLCCGKRKALPYLFAPFMCDLGERGENTQSKERDLLLGKVDKPMLGSNKWLQEIVLSTNETHINEPFFFYFLTFFVIPWN